MCLDYIFSSSCSSSLVVGVAVAIGSLYLLKKLSFIRKMTAAIPGPRLNVISNLPLFFNVLRGQYHTYTFRLHEYYGSDVVRVGFNQVSLADPSELRRILATHQFRKGAIYEANQFLKPSVFSTTDPEVNKTRRRQLGTTYSMSTIRLLEDQVLEHGPLSLMKVWDNAIQSNAGRVNYYYSFHGLAFDVIGKLGFGECFGILPTGNNRIINAVHKTMRLVIAEGQIPLLKKMHWLVPELAEAQRFLIDVAHRAIDRRRGQEQPGHFIDILQKFLDARDPETGEFLDRDSLTAEIVLLLVAGTDTTSNTLTWTIMHLMHNPEVYKRLKQEIRQVFSADKVIRFEEARSRLPYLHAVILESMRLSPSVSGYLPRRVPANTVLLDKYKLKDDDEICVSFGACHRNPKIWEDPQRFDPERFMGPDSESRAKDILAFSTGVRMCIGRNLAWMELYTTLANIICNYDFELPKDGPYGPHNVDGRGYPREIPGVAFTTCGPASPQTDCWLKISKV